MQLLKGEGKSPEPKQKSNAGRAIILDDSDLADYTPTSYLKDLNRHMQLVLEWSCCRCCRGVCAVISVKKRSLEWYGPTKYGIPVTLHCILVLASLKTKSCIGFLKGVYFSEWVEKTSCRRTWTMHKTIREEALWLWCVLYLIQKREIVFICYASQSITHHACKFFKFDTHLSLMGNH